LSVFGGLQKEQEEDLKQTRDECLTAEQVSFYNDKGYLVLQKHLELLMSSEYRDEIARLEC